MASDFRFMVVILVSDRKGSNAFAPIEGQISKVSRHGHVFSSSLPSVPAGAQVALKITAEDESGNRLINEISPAFLGQALIYFPIIMQGAIP
jgi:hypothetical protein